jgi:ABC-2 type transport system permease protein
VNRPAAPGFFRHLWLLWGLRLNIGLNRGPGKSRLLSVGAFLLSSAPAWGLGVTFYGLMRLRPIAESGVWPFFILNLLCFVTAAVWVTWPLMSAGVDDHSELSRYAPFPISPFRLLIASTVASLFEPRALVFYAPLTGAALGYASVHPVRAQWFAVLLYCLFALLNAAWSRVGLHLVLNVLREKHSAGIIGGGFVLFLVAASFIPPIDTSWLTAVGEGGVEKLDMSVIVNATLALGRVPPGFFGDALLELTYGYRRNALANGVGMLLFTLMGFGIAYALLLRFHRSVGRAGPAVKESGDNDPFARTRDRYTTLVVREALDLWRNPRARLLASVPFVLAILLKLMSGRALFEYLLGASVDAWLMGGLCTYGAVVMASTFSQNTFAYDGHGLAMLIAAPVELGDVLRAKNIVQGLAAAGMAVLVGVF